MTLLDNCKKELAVLRDDLDKLVKCLQDASQSDNIKDFQEGVGCADDMSIVLCADLFVLRRLAYGGEEIKDAPKVEPLKSEIIEALPVKEEPKAEPAKEEVKAEPIKDEVEVLKEEIKNVIAL